MKYPNDESAADRERRDAEREANKVTPGAPAEQPDQEQNEEQQGQERRAGRAGHGQRPAEGDPNAA